MINEISERFGPGIFYKTLSIFVSITFGALGLIFLYALIVAYPDGFEFSFVSMLILFSISFIVIYRLSYLELSYDKEKIIIKTSLHIKVLYYTELKKAVYYKYKALKGSSVPFQITKVIFEKKNGKKVKLNLKPYSNVKIMDFIEKIENLLTFYN